MQITDDPIKWLEYSKIDLKDSKILFTEGEFRNSLYLLQQSSEKLGKSLLIFMNWISNEDENEESKTMREVIGIQPRRPIDYGHEWHSQFFRDLEGLVDSMGFFISLFEEIDIKDKDFRNEMEKLKADLPNQKNRIENAKKIQEIKITDAEISQNVQSWESWLSFIIPKIDALSGEISKSLKKAKTERKVKRVLKSSGFPITKEVKKLLLGLKNIENKQLLMTQIKFSILLLPVCHLSILLHSFIWDRYPDSRFTVEHNENNSFVKNYNKLYQLLSHCIESIEESKPF